MINPIEQFNKVSKILIVSNEQIKVLLSAAASFNRESNIAKYSYLPTPYKLDKSGKAV